MADDPKEELERYKTALSHAFQQLDWCIGYLQGIRKPHIARSLSQNRMHIARDIAGEDETELPSQSPKAAGE
jgi:hypothetical protein